MYYTLALTSCRLTDKIYVRLQISTKKIKSFINWKYYYVVISLYGERPVGRHEILLWLFSVGGGENFMNDPLLSWSTPEEIIYIQT